MLDVVCRCLETVSVRWQWWGPSVMCAGMASTTSHKTTLLAARVCIPRKYLVKHSTMTGCA